MSDKPVERIKTAEERLAVDGAYSHSDMVLNTVTLSFAKYDAMLDEVSELRAAYEAQAKHIAELEAATEHLGLTPQQAKDGLARHKAQVAEIESLVNDNEQLRKQVEGIAKSIQKHFELSGSDLAILMSNF